MRWIESWGPFAEGKNNLFQNEQLLTIGKKYNKTVAQIVLRWLTQRGVVTIPKSVHTNRIEENFNIFDFRLTDDDMNNITGLDQRTTLFMDHREPSTVKALSGFRVNI